MTKNQLTTANHDVGAVSKNEAMSMPFAQRTHRINGKKKQQSKRVCQMYKPTNISKISFVSGKHTVGTKSNASDIANIEQKS